MIKFFSLKTSANNIGEEIQILASSRFYPVINEYLNKERLNKYKFDKPAKIIINGHFMRNYNRFYLNDDKISPLLISMHISPNISEMFFKIKKHFFF